MNSPCQSCEPVTYVMDPDNLPTGLPEGFDARDTSPENLRLFYECVGHGCQGDRIARADGTVLGTLCGECFVADESKLFGKRYNLCPDPFDLCDEGKCDAVRAADTMTYYVDKKSCGTADTAHVEFEKVLRPGSKRTKELRTIPMQCVGTCWETNPISLAAGTWRARVTRTRGSQVSVGPTGFLIVED